MPSRRKPASRECMMRRRERKGPSMKPPCCKASTQLPSVSVTASKTRELCEKWPGSRIQLRDFLRQISLMVMYCRQSKCQMTSCWTRLVTVTILWLLMPLLNKMIRTIWLRRKKARTYSEDLTSLEAAGEMRHRRDLNLLHNRCKEQPVEIWVLHGWWSMTNTTHINLKYMQWLQ